MIFAFMAGYMACAATYFALERAPFWGYWTGICLFWVVIFIREARRLRSSGMGATGG